MFAQFFRCFRTKHRAAMAPIKTFAFIDLETTGLPSMEFNRTKITELTILAVQVNHLGLGCLPRVQNKLTLCFNPRKQVHFESERITGLSNSDLEHLSPFTQDTVIILNEFLKHNPEPICLVAHNGNMFDYPILRTEIDKRGTALLDGLLCIDSLEAFRQLDAESCEPVAQPEPADVPLEFRDDFDTLLCKVMDEYEDRPGTGVKRALDQQKVNETTPNQSILDKKKKTTNEPTSKRPKVVNSRKQLNFKESYKLGDVYRRLTSKEPENAHEAEQDVNMLALSAATLGDRFISWANKHSRLFVDIPMMVPGKRIGT